MQGRKVHEGYTKAVGLRSRLLRSRLCGLFGLGLALGRGLRRPGDAPRLDLRAPSRCRAIGTPLWHYVPHRTALCHRYTY